MSRPEDDDFPIEEPRGRGLMRAVKAIAIVSVLILAEVVGAAILIPSATETETLARGLVAASSGVSLSDNAQDDGLEGYSDDTREVEIGSFSVTRFNQESDTTLSIDFELYGAVLADDVDAFNTQFDVTRNRVSEQIVLTLHSAELSELADPGLGLIKRRILERTNRALGKPLVRDVLFTSFNFVER